MKIITHQIVNNGYSCLKFNILKTIHHI